MAIEINDPSPSSSSDDSEIISSGDLQPICPLDATAKSCLLNGSIQNIRLADLFNWKRVVDASSKTENSFANLFQRRSSNVQKDSSDVSITRRESPVEVGIDALECVELGDVFAAHQETQKGDSLQKTGSELASNSAGMLSSKGFPFLSIYPTPC